MTPDSETRLLDLLERIAVALEPADTLYSVEQTAKRLGVSERKVRAWIDEGILQAVNVGDDRKNLRVLRGSFAQLGVLRGVDPKQPAMRRKTAKHIDDRY